MKNTLYLLISFFMISCSPYKNEKINNYVNYDPSKIYELQLNYGEKIIVKQLKQENHQYTFLDKNKQQSSISKQDVASIRKKKFSWWKTIAATVGVSALLIAIPILIYQNSPF